MLEMYKCESCGKMVLVIQDGDGELVCCKKPMVKLAEKTDDAGKEKHVPVIETIPGGIRVKIGAVPHPMEPAHYIKGVEVIGDKFLLVGNFAPGQKPEMEFLLPKTGSVRKVRIFCNVHGLWASRP